LHKQYVTIDNLGGWYERREYERQEQEKIEAQRKAEEQARALALEK